MNVGLPTWRLRWLTSGQWGVGDHDGGDAGDRDPQPEGRDDCRTSVGRTRRRRRHQPGLRRRRAGERRGRRGGRVPGGRQSRAHDGDRLAGGRTKLVVLIAAVLALVLSPLGRFAHMIPLAALAGVLFFIGGRLIKIGRVLKDPGHESWEFSLAIISALGVILIGVEQGLGIAVGLAILDQTWRSARPRMVELGRRTGTTSWEPEEEEGVERVDHILAVFFGEELFFANAGVFRRDDARPPGQSTRARITSSSTPSRSPRSTSRDSRARPGRRRPRQGHDLGLLRARQRRRARTDREVGRPRTREDRLLRQQRRRRECGARDRGDYCWANWRST